MKDTINIALLVGSVRTKRESIKAAHYVADFANRYPEISVTFVDPRELQLPDEGEDVKDPKYSEVTKSADAFIIVTPEYNHSIPGSLKRMLDSEYVNYYQKPVALAGVSSGPWGGVRVCEALLPVCHRLGMVNIRPELYFPKIQDLFDDSGAMRSEHVARYEKDLTVLYDELIMFARLLKVGRNQ